MLQPALLASSSDRVRSSEPIAFSSNDMTALQFLQVSINYHRTAGIYGAALDELPDDPAERILSELP